MALPFLKNSISIEQITSYIGKLEESLRIAMFLVGAKNIDELKNSNLIIKGETRQWLNDRGFETINYSRR